MFESLLDLVKQHAGEAIVNNPAIPNEKNNEVITEASSSIVGGLQNLISQGGLKNVLNMFSGQGNASSAVTQQVSGGFIQNLMDKFGLDQQAASGVADKIVPNVLNDMVKKTNDPSDNSFDIQGIFNHLSGGNTSGMDMQGMLNKLKGGDLDVDRDGDTDLQDLMAAFKGGEGGIMDKIKGMFN